MSLQWKLLKQAWHTANFLCNNQLEEEYMFKVMFDPYFIGHKRINENVLCGW